MPLKNRHNYIVFAERRGQNTAVALGPPLQKRENLMQRIRAVYTPGYSECLVIRVMLAAPAPRGVTRDARDHMEVAPAPPVIRTQRYFGQIA